MGLINFFKEQFAAVIEWKDQTQDVLFYKYPFKSDEVKDGSKLIIAPGQGCLLIYEGKVQGVLEQEGVYPLQTDNDPFITTLSKFMQRFESEHKLRLYFYRTAEVTNLGWGTSNRVTYEEPTYRFPVSLGVYGNYSFKLKDAKLFLTEISGLSDLYTVLQSQMLIQSRIEQQLTVTLATSAYSILEIDSKLHELAGELNLRLNDEFSALGFSLSNFKIQGTSFDEQTLKQINQIANARAGSLAAEKAGLTYTEMERIQALRDAARNDSGFSGAGLQVNLGSHMSNAFTATHNDQVNHQPDAVAQMIKLKTLFDQGILTAEEFESKKKQWLDKL
jgi:membrane protease subunit (stomatin/prohibitin family)